MNVSRLFICSSAFMGFYGFVLCIVSTLLWPIEVSDCSIYVAAKFVFLGRMCSEPVPSFELSPQTGWTPVISLLRPYQLTIISEGDKPMKQTDNRKRFRHYVCMCVWAQCVCRCVDVPCVYVCLFLSVCVLVFLCVFMLIPECVRLFLSMCVCVWLGTDLSSIWQMPSATQLGP